MSFLRALRHRRFALLWTGQTLSRIGDHLYEIALAWWVLEKTGSALTMGAVLILSLAPMLLFSLVGGVAVDRLPRARVMFVSDLVRGAVVAIVAGLALSGRLEVWHLYIASLLFGMADAFFHPAYTALVPDLTPPSDWASANSLSSLGVQAGRVLGPALGAGIVALGGIPLAFALNALSFFISALFLLPLREPSSGPLPASVFHPHSILADLSEGIQVVVGWPVLWLTILVASLANITLAGPHSVSLPFLVKDHMHGDVQLLGLLYAMFPVGYALGGLWWGRQQRLRRRGPIGYGALALAGVGILIMGLELPLWVILLAALVNGAALETLSLIWINILQEFVPHEKLGRVASIDAMGSYLLLPIGFGLAGWATTEMGPALVFMIGGGATAVLALAALLHPALRRLD